MKKADEKYGPLFDKYRTQDLRKVAQDPDALKIGKRLYMTYCTNCHGSDAGGGPGYPSLRDGDWLYGGEPEMIKTSILNGRSGLMPAHAAMLGPEGVFNVSEYVLSLSGRKVNANAAAAGKEKFDTVCAACHNKDGKGNKLLGAPNLTDTVWLYGGSQAAVMKTISEGRQGNMPAHGEFLGEAKVHLLAAYIYSLSNPPEKKAAK
jgi:cytochrome c oxidase cbb3-type subunit 3